MTYLKISIIGLFLSLSVNTILYAEMTDVHSLRVIDSFEQTRSHYNSISGFSGIDRSLYPDSTNKWVFSVWGNSLFASFEIPNIDTKKGTYFRNLELGLGMPVPFLDKASLRIVAGLSGRFYSTSNPITQYYTDLINGAHGLFGTSLAIDFRYNLSEIVVLHLAEKIRSDPYKLNLKLDSSPAESEFSPGDTHVCLSSKTTAVGFDYIFQQTDFLKKIGLYAGFDIDYSKIKGNYDLIKDETPYEYRRQWTVNVTRPRIILGFNWTILTGAINYCDNAFSYVIGLNHYF